MGGGAVDGFNLISAAQARPGGRGAGVGLVDEYVAVHIGLVDDGAHAAVGAVEHHLEVFLLFFRHIYGIGIQRFQHSVHGGPFNSAHLQGIHVGAVQLFQNGILDFHPLA